MGDGRPDRASARSPPRHPETRVIRWLLVTVLALVLFSGLTPWLRRFGLGRLPGDLHFRLFGREWSLPIASTLVLSMIAAGIARLI